MNKVLFITDTLSKSSGITSVIVNYLTNINYNKVKIDVLTFGNYDNEIVSKLSSLGAEMYFMPHLKITTILKTISDLKCFFKKHNYEIVHSHFSQMDCLIFPIAQKYGNVKHTISHSHNTKYSDSKLKSIRNYIMCLPIPYIADTWAACSELAGIFLYGGKFKTSPKSLVINNAINIDNFTFDEGIRNKYRSELNLTEKDIAIGMVGSLRPQKNHCFMLEVFNELIKHNPTKKYRLIIAGDGSERKNVEELICKYNLSEKVILLGRRTDANKLLQAFDIFVLPSLYEGLPVVGVEAQTSGLPCLMSDTITREVGITDYEYISLNSIAKWVEAIENITIKTEKRCLSAELVSQKGFNIELEAKKLELYYEDL